MCPGADHMRAAGGIGDRLRGIRTGFSGPAPHAHRAREELSAGRPTKAGLVTRGESLLDAVHAVVAAQHAGRARRLLAGGQAVPEVAGARLDLVAVGDHEDRARVLVLLPEHVGHGRLDFAVADRAKDDRGWVTLAVALDVVAARDAERHGLTLTLRVGHAERTAHTDLAFGADVAARTAGRRLDRLAVLGLTAGGDVRAVDQVVPVVVLAVVADLGGRGGRVGGLAGIAGAVEVALGLAGG